ncbi:MAG: GAF domain-containing protein [Anaerolineales bacterium]|uniref:cache domain-containing protein n=1 Tax=Candidatus Villigracilis proximus TaxID=3140683 RepID=UPI003136046B|nr:GAF domain-containing protein [Anaerolineales bacterium]
MSQSIKTNTLKEVTDQNIRNGYLIIIVLMSAAILTASLFAYFGFINGQQQLYIVSAVLMATVLIDIWLFALMRSGRFVFAMMLVITLFLINVTIVPFFIQDLGAIIAVTSIVVTIAITGLAMPSSYSLSGIAVGVTAGLIIFLIDLSLPDNRLNVPQLEQYVPIIVIFITIPFGVIVIREFRKFSLRIKVAFSILVTGSIIVAALLGFGIGRVASILDNLSQKFETSVAENTILQINRVVQTEAGKADILFSKTVSDVLGIAAYRAQLETQQKIFIEGAYWNASEKILRLPNGQYGNSPADPSSIFIPNIYVVNEALLADLNTTIYLDFYATSFLKSHPEVVSIYYISDLGYTTYYPNINLARNIPANFDVKNQSFFSIATPQNNPEKLPRWTDPYQDPAGTGLIVTLSVPVYTKTGEFKGVIGADIQLTQISKNISNIKLGSTGFAFLVDKNGTILAMPPQGYALFGMQPEEIPLNETPKQSIIAKGTDELQAITQKIISGETSLDIIQINNVNNYIGYAPLQTPGYRLAIIAPSSELNIGLITSRDELQKEIDASFQGAITILVFLFIGSLLISLWVGQVITKPLVNLTKTVEDVAAGNLSARANVEAQDETGLLAASINIMTERLNDTLSGLEERVAERTQELENANEKNTRRANQFEAIARVAQTIRSTQALEALLPLITVAISENFDFYHVGIFLLDTRREYAVLVAANSEGGKKMLGRNHRLLIGDGIVGYATNSGQPRVALNVGLDSAYFNNPDLPDTLSEIALPLRIGSETFGALDVQSNQLNAFAEEDINILLTLADQVSVAIQNARSYQQTREALEQAEAASIQLSGQQWKQFLTRQNVQGFSFDGVDTIQLNQSDKQRPHSLSIPLTLRGTKIGTIKLNAANPDRIWTNDEIAMVQAAAERTSFALENARLLQEAQKRAAKERTIGEISAKIGSTSNLENILQTAIQELGNTLPGTDIAIQFSTNQETE